MAVTNKFRSAYDGKRVSVAVDFTDTVSMCEQHHKKECDINYVLTKYDKTGLITHVNNATAAYGDYTIVNEYQDSLNMVMQAQEAFDDLPSNIRKQFENDPGKFFEFATDPKNNDAMIELGLANPIKSDPVVDAINGLTNSLTQDNAPA